MICKKFPHSCKTRFCCRQLFLGKWLCDDLAATVGLGGTQLDPQEVLFTEALLQAFRRPVEQFQQLRVVQQMPVVSDDGLIAAFQPGVIDEWLWLQAHLLRRLGEERRRGAQDLCQPRHGHDTPVAPHDRLPACGEMRQVQRRLRIAFGKHGCHGVTSISEST